MVVEQAVICSEHKSHVVARYCRDCRVPICVVCSEIDHAGHSIVGLTELKVELEGDLSDQLSQQMSILTQLERLLGEVAPQTSQLHQYTDRELDTVERTLEDKRRALHNEVNERAIEARRQMTEELRLVEHELAQLQSGAQVLDALSKRQGVVDGKLGGLICEKLTFDEFMGVVDAPPHDPPRMLEMLALQLPTQNLQEMCDLISWTNITVEPTQQVFPM